VAQSTNKFLYDGWNLLTELNNVNALIRSYVWGLDLSGSEQGAGGVGGLLQIAYYGAQTTNCFAAYDGNGNVAALVNAADGNVVANYEYDPFGQTVRTTGVMAKNCPFRFSTKYTDDESDFLYYGYRSYNPSTGRWLSRDPIEERGGENVYCFVSNVPVLSWDYLGMGVNLAPFNGHVANRSKATLTISGDWREIEQYYHFVNGDVTPENRHETIVHYPYSIWADLNVRMQGYIKEIREPRGTHVLAPGHTMKGDWTSGATRIVDSDDLIASTHTLYRGGCCEFEEPLPFRLKGGKKIVVLDCPNGAGVYWR